MSRIGFLFDLDGVLIDSEREYSFIWETIDSHYPTGVENFASVIKGMTLDKILGDYFPDYSIRPGVEEMLYRMEKEMVYRYCEGVEPFLRRMISERIPRAVVTSSNSDKMVHLHHDIPEFSEIFPIIIDSSKVRKSKPHPEGYLSGAESIDVNIANCAVFEDSVQGVMAGRNAGAFVVGICGTKSPEELSPFCDILINNFEELDFDRLKKILEERK